MKRFRFLLIIACAVLLTVSCVKPKFTPDQELLYGTWVSGDTHYRFDRSYRLYELFDSSEVRVNGAYWNPADDVSEEEAQAILWSLDEADLTIVKQMYMGGKVPNTYTVTALTNTTMTLKDNYNATKTYNKI